MLLRRMNVVKETSNNHKIKSLKSKGFTEVEPLETKKEVEKGNGGKKTKNSKKAEAEK